MTKKFDSNYNPKNKTLEELENDFRKATRDNSFDAMGIIRNELFGRSVVTIAKMFESIKNNKTKSLFYVALSTFIIKLITLITELLFFKIISLF